MFDLQGVDMDQSDGGMMNEDNQTMFFGATNNADFVGGPNNAEQGYSNKVFIKNITLKKLLSLQNNDAIIRNCIVYPNYIECFRGMVV